VSARIARIARIAEFARIVAFTRLLFECGGISNTSLGGFVHLL
jgi:hypothetical protein